MGAVFCWQLFYLANGVAGTPVEGCSEPAPEAGVDLFEELELDLELELEVTEVPFAWTSLPAQAWGRC